MEDDGNKRREWRKSVRNYGQREEKKGMKSQLRDMKWMLSKQVNVWVKKAICGTCFPQMGKVVVLSLDTWLTDDKTREEM